eukprot:220248_1
MGQIYSKQWMHWGCHFSAGSVAYFAIFFRTFANMMKKKLKHNNFKNIESQALNYSTNLISTINGIGVTMAGFSLFYYKLWTDNNPVLRIHTKIPYFVFYSW